MRTHREIIAFAALTLAACEPSKPAAPAPQAEQGEPKPILIRQRNTPDHMELQALGGGKLISDKGCLRMSNPSSKRLIIWRPDVSVTPDGDGFVDPTTGTAVCIGDDIIMGGGEVDGVNPAGLADPIPANCTGPYWLGGSGFFPAPRQDWRTVRIAERYSIKLPADLADSNPKPDALPANWSGSGLKLAMSDGKDQCGEPQRTTAASWSYLAYTDQRPVKVLRQRPENGPETMEVVVPGVEGPRGVTPPRGEVCLRLRAECASPRDCDQFRAMISTIRFGDLGKPD